MYAIGLTHDDDDIDDDDDDDDDKFLLHIVLINYCPRSALDNFIVG